MLSMHTFGSVQLPEFIMCERVLYIICCSIFFTMITILMVLINASLVHQAGMVMDNDCFKYPNVEVLKSVA